LLALKALHQKDFTILGNLSDRRLIAQRLNSNPTLLAPTPIAGMSSLYSASSPISDYKPPTNTINNKAIQNGIKKFAIVFNNYKNNPIIIDFFPHHREEQT
jgi:hypothetical protein